jgi:hypothetical protein
VLYFFAFLETKPLDVKDYKSFTAIPKGPLEIFSTVKIEDRRSNAAGLLFPCLVMLHTVKNPEIWPMTQN